MSSPYRKFKCRICKEKTNDPSDKDISVCKDCEEYKEDENRINTN